MAGDRDQHRLVERQRFLRRLIGYRPRLDQRDAAADPVCPPSSDGFQQWAREERLDPGMLRGAARHGGALTEVGQGANALLVRCRYGVSSGKCRSSTLVMLLLSIQSMPGWCKPPPCSPL